MAHGINFNYGMKFAGIKCMEIFNIIISSFDEIKKNIIIRIALLWGPRIGFSQKDKHQ